MLSCPPAVVKLWGKGEIAAGFEITALNSHGVKT